MRPVLTWDEWVSWVTLNVADPMNFEITYRPWLIPERKAWQARIKTRGALEALVGWGEDPYEAMGDLYHSSTVPRADSPGLTKAQGRIRREVEDWMSRDVASHPEWRDRVRRQRREE